MGVNLKVKPTGQQGVEGAQATVSQKKTTLADYRAGQDRLLLGCDVLLRSGSEVHRGVRESMGMEGN